MSKKSVKKPHRTEKNTTAVSENSLANLKPFKAGAEWTGNAGGRPKKKPITEAYARLLENPANADKLAKAIFDEAVKKASVFAAKEIREALEGKALQAVRMDGQLKLRDSRERSERLNELLAAAAERIESIN